MEKVQMLTLLLSEMQWFAIEKIVENKIRYALKFPNQKHLPVRVMKNILEAEDNQDENGNCGFLKTMSHCTWYENLIRNLGLAPCLVQECYSLTVSPISTKGEQKHTLKMSFFLFHKGDVYPCTSCKKDVPFRDVVKCSSCQGNCHKECTSRSVGSKGGNAAPILICKSCIQKRNLMLASYNSNASYVPPQQKSNGQLPVTAPKIIFKVGSSHSAEPVAKVEAQPVAKVKALPIAKVETWPTTTVETQNIAEEQAQPKTKTKKSKSEKARKPKKSKRSHTLVSFGRKIRMTRVEVISGRMM